MNLKSYVYGVWLKIKNASVVTLKKTAIFSTLAVFLLCQLTQGVSAHKNKSREPLTVVVDAGHGGMDPGKVGSDNTLEKDVNLAIALKLQAELEAKGVKVIMTRSDDSSLETDGAVNKKKSDMVNRLKLINEAAADYLVSIHQNSFPDPAVKGGQVFYYGTSDAGRQLAYAIQKNIRSDIDPDNNRQPKEGNDYYLLRESECPGVIVECGFLSSPEEAKKLVTEEYQIKMAACIAAGIFDMQ